MRARFVYESINFQRGKDPKRAMGIGINAKELAKVIKASVDKHEIFNIKRDYGNPLMYKMYKYLQKYAPIKERNEFIQDIGEWAFDMEKIPERDYLENGAIIWIKPFMKDMFMEAFDLINTRKA